MNKINVNVELSLSEFDESMRNLSLNMGGNEFNKIAIKMIDTLIKRSFESDSDEDLIKRINKSYQTYLKYYKRED